jgi:hypothetical protein
MMDPNAALKRLLELARAEHVDFLDFDEMAQTFLDLHEWLTVRKGYPPGEWMDAFRKNSPAPLSEDP